MTSSTPVVSTAVAYRTATRLSPVRASRTADALICAVSSIAFASLARAARDRRVSAWEERAFRSINNLSATIRLPVMLVMQAGSLPAVAVAALAMRRRSGVTAKALAISGTAAWGLCKVAKRFVGRGRPADHLDAVVVHGSVQRGLGFPSGHAAVVMTLAAVASRVVPRPVRSIVWATSALVGLARTYVGAHLPLDTAGGAALGMSVGSLTNVALGAGR